MMKCNISYLGLLYSSYRETQLSKNNLTGCFRFSESIFFSVIDVNVAYPHSMEYNKQLVFIQFKFIFFYHQEVSLNSLSS